MSDFRLALRSKTKTTFAKSTTFNITIISTDGIDPMCSFIQLSKLVVKREIIPTKSVIIGKTNRIPLEIFENFWINVFLDMLSMIHHFLTFYLSLYKASVDLKKMLQTIFVNFLWIWLHISRKYHIHNTYSIIKLYK